MRTQTAALPPLSRYDVYHKSKWTTKGHKWTFRTYWLKSEFTQNNTSAELDKLNLLFCDGKVVKRLRNEGDRPEWEPWGPYLAAQPISVRSPYERVIAIRGAGGLGKHWDTCFYGLNRTTITFIGRSPGLNANGPVAWKGSPNLWLFDDCDFYRDMHENKGVTRHLLFRIEKGKTMTKVEEWPSTKGVKRVVRLKELEE
ncbi:MAG: hypothetical protein HZC36_13720 [Armatimonadetes bacterium]|nr:hypothetical protein [Armatimonadota bacterium]